MTAQRNCTIRPLHLPLRKYFFLKTHFWCGRKKIASTTERGDDKKGAPEKFFQFLNDTNRFTTIIVVSREQ